MDREQQEFHSHHQTGLGCGLSLAAAALTGFVLWQSGVHLIIAWCIAPLIAGGIALTLALLLSRSAVPGYYRTAAEDRTFSRGRQLVGEMCLLCRKRIASIAEGEFCPSCASAVHYECVRPQATPSASICPRCGADPSVNLAPDYHG